MTFELDLDLIRQIRLQRRVMIKKTRFEGQEFAVQIVRTYVGWIDVELEDLVNMVIDLSDDVRLQAAAVHYGTLRY